MKHRKAKFLKPTLMNIEFLVFLITYFRNMKIKIVFLIISLFKI